jgi:hypothetical protein
MVSIAVSWSLSFNVMRNALVSLIPRMADLEVSSVQSWITNYNPLRQRAHQASRLQGDQLREASQRDDNESSVPPSVLNGLEHGQGEQDKMAKRSKPLEEDHVGSEVRPNDD